MPSPDCSEDAEQGFLAEGLARRNSQDGDDRLRSPLPAHSRGLCRAPQEAGSRLAECSAESTDRSKLEAADGYHHTKPWPCGQRGVCRQRRGYHSTGSNVVSSAWCSTGSFTNRGQSLEILTLNNSPVELDADGKLRTILAEQPGLCKPVDRFLTFGKSDIGRTVRSL